MQHIRHNNIVPVATSTPMPTEDVRNKTAAFSILDVAVLGILVGSVEGTDVGLDGTIVGILVGVDGADDGLEDGTDDGRAEGTDDGLAEGTYVGLDGAELG